MNVELRLEPCGVGIGEYHFTYEIYVGCNPRTGYKNRGVKYFALGPLYSNINKG